MARLDEEAFIKWQRKRKCTTIAFMLESVLIGMDYGLTFLTLWIYLEQLVKPMAPKVFYGLIAASYLTPSMTFSVIVGRLVDRYRNVRTTFFILNTSVIIGNFIYALPFSPWLLLFGRLLAGVGGPLRSVISGELARCYPTKELSSKFSSMGMAYSLGFVAGPGFNFAFKSADYWIGPWHITYVNMPGLYMSLFFLLMQVTCFFMVFDLSREYDLKNEMLKEKANKRYFLADTEKDSFGWPLSQRYISHVDDYSYRILDEETPLLENADESFSGVIKKLFSRFDTCLILMTAFVGNYFAVSFDLWVPLTVVDVLYWTITEMNIIIFGTGLACVAGCLILIYYPMTDERMFYMAVWSTFSLTIMETVFIVMQYYNENVALNIIMWVIFCLLFSTLVVMEEVFLVGCIAKMVSSRIQTFADSIRLSMYRLGALVALLTSALVFDWIRTVGFLHICFILSVVILLIIRRNTLKYPAIIVR